MATAETGKDKLKSQFSEHPTRCPLLFTDDKAEVRRGSVACLLLLMTAQRIRGRSGLDQRLFPVWTVEFGLQKT